ncbi:hypothetical protein Leryth_026666 [Lithospermum erythrorhizon]|nr:hypothetical protein Leryth_026666 [Lithospermum erythrorhizon]
MGQEAGSSSVSSPLQMFSMMSLSPGIGSSPYAWFKDISPEERGLRLINLFLNCVNHVAAGSIGNANIGLEHLSHLVSPDGDAMQRLVAYFNEALADRVVKSWRGIYRALNSTKGISVAEEFLAKKLFYDLCPFLRIAYVITNQAILEAMEDEEMVHIIDLDCFEPAQWVNLLQSFSLQKKLKFQLRITGIHEKKEVLERMACILNNEAEKLDIGFQFNPIVSKVEDLDTDRLRVKTGEALAISSVLQLNPLLAFDDQVVFRHSPASSSNGSNMVHIPRNLQRNRLTLNDFLENDSNNNNNSTPGFSPDSATSSPFFIMPPKMATFLTLLWSFFPKLLVVTEQEANHSGLKLMERIDEALHFYGAFFDCLESKIPRGSVERYQVEKIVFGQEIKNIVACEGLERTTRHEKLEKWIPRLEMAGFMKVDLSFNGMIQARKLLHNNNYDGYMVKEKNGYFFICWHDQPLYSVSAWRFRR